MAQYWWNQPVPETVQPVFVFLNQLPPQGTPIFPAPSNSIFVNPGTISHSPNQNITPLPLGEPRQVVYVNGSYYQHVSTLATYPSMAPPYYQGYPNISVIGDSGVSPARLQDFQETLQKYGVGMPPGPFALLAYEDLVTITAVLDLSLYQSAAELISQLKMQLGVPTFVNQHTHNLNTTELISIKEILTNFTARDRGLKMSDMVVTLQGKNPSISYFDVVIALLHEWFGPSGECLEVVISHERHSHLLSDVFGVCFPAINKDVFEQLLLDENQNIRESFLSAIYINWLDTGFFWDADNYTETPEYDKRYRNGAHISDSLHGAVCCSMPTLRVPSSTSIYLATEEIVSDSPSIST